MKNLKKALVLFLCAVLLVAGSVMGTLAYLTAQTEVVNNTFTVGNIKIYLDETDIDGSKTKYGYDALLHADRDLHNDYTGDNKLIPGRAVTKDPMITVLAGSEDCYVRAVVTVAVPGYPSVAADATTEEIEAWKAGFTAWAGSFANNYILHDNTTAGVSEPGFNTKDWNVTVPSIDSKTIDTTNKTITYYLTYKTNDGTNIVTTKQDENNTLPALFDDICVPTTLDSTTLAYLEGMTINIEAHAIQSEGFVDTNDPVYISAEQNAWIAFDAQNH